MRVTLQLSADSRQRLARIGQGPWPVLTGTAEPGESVMLARAGGVTGYRADVQVATWSLPSVPDEDLAGRPHLWAPWPGRRGVMIASEWEQGGDAHSAESGSVFLLAAVWAPAPAGVHVGLATREGGPLDVPERGLWRWLHGEEAEALAALG